MQGLKQIKDLKKGDRVSGTNGGVVQIISLINNKLFYYNEKTREFKEKTVNISDFVFLENWQLKKLKGG